MAQNIVTAFAKMDGQTVGVIGNNPLTLAGCLDIGAANVHRNCPSLVNNSKGG